MPSPVFYSVSPFGTGDIKDAANITISGGVATLSAAQTGNIGAGVCIEYNSLKAYIAPNRIGFDSGGTTELLPDTKIVGATSGSTGIVRYVEVTSGTWAGGDAAGWIYFEKTTGTFQDNEIINRTKPTASTDIATINGTIQGNIGNGNTEFVVKTATGGTPSDQTSIAVDSIHHEYASLSDWEAGFTDSTHINNTDLTAADVVAFACCYYDHVDYTKDTAAVDVNFGTTGENNYFHIYTPTGNSESINSQRHTGKYNTNKYVLYNDSTRVIRVRQPYAVVDGLQIYNSAADSLLQLRYPIADGSFEIKNCIFRGTENTTSNGVYSSNISYITNYLIFNNLFYDINTSGYSGGILHGQIDCKVFYNTTYNCRIGYLGDDANVILKNNIANHLNNNYQQYYGTFSTLSGYNISSDSTSTGGTNDQNSVSLTFSDATNDDFSLALTDTEAIEQGTDLRSEGIWRDIRGVERDESTPDIGAFERTLADVRQGSDYQITYLPDGSLLVTQLPTVASGNVLEWDDEFAAATGLTASVTDTISFSETTAPIAKYLASLADTVSFGETVTPIESLLAAISDAISLSDSATASGAAARAILDTLSLATSVTAIAGRKVSVSDGIALTEALVALAAYRIATSDTIGLSDAAKTALIASITDTISFSDSSSGLAKLIASITESLSIVDSVSGVIGSLASASVLDTLSLSDSVSGLANYTVTINDSISLDDATAQLAKYLQSIVDTIGLSDSAQIITGNGLVTVTFSMKTPGASFTMKTPGITFTLKS